jgi:hypothetical protein
MTDFTISLLILKYPALLLFISCYFENTERFFLPNYHVIVRHNAGEVFFREVESFFRNMIYIRASKELNCRVDIRWIDDWFLVI